MEPRFLIKFIAFICAAVACGCGGSNSAPKGNSNPSVQGTAAFQPTYYVLSLQYAPPGDMSGNTYYGAAATYGAIADVGSVFAGSPTLQFSSGASPQGATSDIGPWFSFAAVPGMPQSFQGAYTNVAANGSTWSLAGAVFSGTDNVDHTQDVFFLWLNPQVLVSQTGTNSGTFQLGTPVRQGIAEPMDVISISVAELLDPTLIPSSKLGPQTVNNVTGLPGLSSLCADPAQCTPADFAAIVNMDALVAVPATDDPSTLDASRFAYVGNSQLYGPSCPGCNTAVNAYWYTDAGISAISKSIIYSVPLRTPAQISGSFTLSPASNAFTWHHTTSAGSATGLHQSQAVLQSSTILCFENSGMFEDTLFHTFLFQQPLGNLSCQ